jgi:hypothetical protein
MPDDIHGPELFEIAHHPSMWRLKPDRCRTN